MYITRESITATATSSGAITTYSSNTLSGVVQAISYAKSTSVPLSTGVSVAITAERSGLAVISLEGDALSSGDTYYPRAATATTTGATSTGSAMIPLWNERLVVTITSGSTTSGSTKSGIFHCYVGG